MFHTCHIELVANLYHTFMHCENLSGIKVDFTQNQFTGSEAARFVLVIVKLRNGTSAFPFNVTVTASEQSPVSAEGNSVRNIYYLTKECLTNR